MPTHMQDKTTSCLRLDWRRSINAGNGLPNCRQTISSFYFVTFHIKYSSVYSALNTLRLYGAITPITLRRFAFPSICKRTYRRSNLHLRFAIHPNTHVSNDRKQAREHSWTLSMCSAHGCELAVDGSITALFHEHTFTLSQWKYNLCEKLLFNFKLIKAVIMWAMVF